MEDKLFKADFTKKLFEVRVTVFENGHSLEVINEDNNKVAISSVIGALETAKSNFYIKQMIANSPQIAELLRKELKAHSELQKKINHKKKK